MSNDFSVLLKRDVRECFALNIPLGGSEKEIAEYVEMSLSIDAIVAEIFSGDCISVLDIHDQIQTFTPLNADDYINEIISNIENLEDEEECLILTP